MKKRLLDVAVVRGVVSIDALPDVGSIYYELAHAISPFPGGRLEARVRVMAAASAPGAGLKLDVRDGVHEYAVWIRPGGLNLAGAAEIPCDNTAWVTIRLLTRNGWARLFRNGAFLGQAEGVANAAASGLAFGSPAGLTDCIADLDWLRYRTRHDI